jgi:hypothetical protein
MSACAHDELTPLTVTGPAYGFACNGCGEVAHVSGFAMRAACRASVAGNTSVAADLVREAFPKIRSVMEE